MPPQVLLVGHCAADGGTLRRWLREHFQAAVSDCDTVDDAVARVQAGGLDLVLANRIFEFSGEEGLELVRRLAGAGLLAATRIMLISNFPQAQASAVAAGAIAGFGKSELRAERARAAVAAALRPNPTADAGRG